MRRALVDPAPLRRRDFRLLVGGQFVSFAGSMLTMVAVPFQVYELTGSTLAVGLIGAAEIVPIVLIALYAGALADAFDRRRLVMFADAGGIVVALALCANALLDRPRVWPLFACAALAASAYALQRPPLDALVPRLVPHEELKPAMAINHMLIEFAQVAGPAVAGVMLATAGLAATYAVDAATFLVALAAFAAMRATPPPVDAERPSLRGILDGIRYARSRPELLGTYLVDMAAMFLAIPFALFPAIAQRYGGPQVLGLMYAAPAAGSFLASMTSGWSAQVHRHGRAVVLAAAGWGAAIALFGVAGDLWLALVCLALAGAADSISGIFRGVIWNETIPDRMRGRLAGIEMISWSSGPTLGNVRAGAVASLAGTRTSVVSGGLLCVIAVAALAAALPSFWNYDARERDGV